MFLNMGDEIINIDNIKRFYVENNNKDSEETETTIWYIKLETYDNDDNKRLIGNCLSKDEVTEKIEVIAEELKNQGLLIEV